MSELETGAVDAAIPTNDVAPAVEVAAPETPTEAVETSLDDDLSAAYDAAVGEPLRGPDGKFVSREPNTEAVEPETEAPAEAKAEDQTSPEAEKVEPAAPAIDPPVSWSREMRDKWSALPPDAQQYIAQRESEAHSQISRLGQQVKAFEPVGKVLEQYRSTFEKHGVDFATGIQHVMNASAALDTDPVTAIHTIARNYGIDLGAMGSPSDSNQQQELYALRNEVVDLKRQIAETRTDVTSYKQREAEQQQVALQSEIAELGAKLPYFSEVREHMARLTAAYQLEEQGWPISKIIEWTYDKATRLDDNVWSKIQADRRTKEAEAAKQKAVEAKKVSSLNVRTTTAARPAARTLDDDLSATFDRIQSRAS